jgi:signal transduction histidine kinase
LILGPAESILATGGNLTELQRRDLAVIHRNATTLLKHVNDLLDLAKLDAGKMTVNYARIDVARELRTIAAHFDALAPQRTNDCGCNESKLSLKLIQVIALPSPVEQASLVNRC